MPVIIQCPHCLVSVEIDSEHLGREVECGQCQKLFIATAPAPPSAPSPPVPVAKSKRDWGDRDRPDERRSRYDDDDFEDRPRRRPRRGFRPDGQSFYDAQDAVRGPANGLIAIGWFAAVVYFLAGVGMTVFLMMVMNEARNRGNGANPPRGEDFVVIVIGAIYSVFAVAFCSVIAIGGHRLKSLKGYAFPLTSSIMAIVSIVFFHPCNPISWGMMAIGIWAIVALNRSDVKWAIDHNRGLDRPRDEEY